MLKNIFVVLVSLSVGAAYAATANTTSHHATAPAVHHDHVDQDSDWGWGHNLKDVHEFETNVSMARLSFSEPGANIHISVAYDHRITEELQLSGFFGWSHYGSNSFSLMGGATYNVVEDSLQNAWFGQVLVGFAGVPTASTTTPGSTSTKFKLSFWIGGGKRFEIVQHVSIRPSVGFSKTAGSSFEFVVTPAVFSVIF